MTTIFEKRFVRRILSWLTMLLALLIATPIISHAHSLFIQSSRYEVDKGKKSPMFFCYGHHVPVDDGVRAAKLKYVQVHTPSGEVREITIRNETSLHSYMVEYDEPGTYILTAETTPGYYTMYIDKKGRTRHAIKPKSAIAEKADKILTSLYSKQYTKTYVVCEKPTAPFPGRIGLDLELVPARDVSTLKPGEELELKVFFKGEPYDGPGEWDATYSGFSTEAEDNFHPKTQVKGGVFKVRLPNAGRWFVRYWIKVDAEGPEKEEFNQAKSTASLVFQIPNKRRNPKIDAH